MTLFYKNEPLGRISPYGQDGPINWGMFIERGEGMPSDLKAFLLFVTNESNIGIDPPFPAEFDEDGNWVLLDGEEMRPIYLPGLHQDSRIAWHWR